ncbi:MAG TPA: hypothetical protein VML50_04420 [Anaeromyxobacter sp.]|nr:hypothetical protein [Anaeromyxobacter sp.]
MTDPRKPGPQPARPAVDGGGASGSPLVLGAQGQLAAAFIQALTKAARAFTLYDPSNALVRQFIADYRARAEAATAAGPLAFEVRPFEIVCGSEVVYREEDRERSLAFRLFRDGVRRLAFAQEVAFPELLQLLQILAVRYTGVRQAEDDVVTLLRKAEFRTITVVAVEGYTSDDDEERGRLGPRAGGEPPPGFDAPFVRLPAPGPIAFRPVPEEALAPLRAEEAPEGLPAGGLRLAAELLGWAAQGALASAEAAQFCAELRDFLVADHQLKALAALAELALRQPAGSLREEVLRGLADPRLLEAVLSAIPPGAAQLPPEAAQLLPFVPGGAVLDLLDGEEDEGRRATLVRLAEARLPADAEAVIGRLARLPAEAARALARAVGARAPARADEAAVALIAHPDPQVQIEALRAASAAAARLPAAAVPILGLLRAPQEPVRLAAAQALERHGDNASAKAVAEALQERKSFSRDEAAALGRALGRLNPGAALRLFDGWLAPRKKGLLRALKADEHEELLRWAAVAGLGAIPGPEAEQRLEAALAAADDALRRHCHATLARRRHEGRLHG